MAWYECFKILDRPLMLKSARFVSRALRWQWCGNAEDEEESVTDRLLEFTDMRWKNMMFQQMTYSIICPPIFDLCEGEGYQVCGLVM